MCNDFLVPGVDAHGVTQFLLHNHSWVRRPVHFPAMLVSGRIYSQLPSPSTRKVLQPSTKLYELQLDGRPLCLVRKAHRSFLSFTPNQVGSISICKNDDVRVFGGVWWFPRGGFADFWLFRKKEIRIHDPRFKYVEVLSQQKTMSMRHRTKSNLLTW